MIEVRRRRRRQRKKSEAHPGEWGVLSYPPDDNGRTRAYGPFTERGADPVAFAQLKRGRKVQIVPFERARAVSDVTGEVGR